MKLILTQDPRRPYEFLTTGVDRRKHKEAVLNRLGPLLPSEHQYSVMRYLWSIPDHRINREMANMLHGGMIDVSTHPLRRVVFSQEQLTYLRSHFEY